MSFVSKGTSLQSSMHDTLPMHGEKTALPATSSALPVFSAEKPQQF